MARFRGMLFYWRPPRCSYFPYKALVYLYFISYAWFSGYYLHDTGFLDEY